jgi:hypothetical protein
MLEKHKTGLGKRLFTVTRCFLYVVASLTVTSIIITPHRNFGVEREIAGSSRILIGIFTTIDDAGIRAMIRTHWLDAEGVCAFQGRPLQQVSALSDSCRIVYTFVLGTPDALSTSLQGNAEYVAERSRGIVALDETHLNIKENMEEGKTHTWFRYASTLTPVLGVDYVGKMDSDTWLDIKRFVDFMDSDLPPAPISGHDNRKRYGGILMEGVACGVKVNAHCKLLRGRAYMAGQFYFVSSDLAKFIFESNYDRYMRVGYEDFDFGLHVMSYPGAINFVVMSGSVLWVHDISTKTLKGWENASNYQLPTRSADLQSVEQCLFSGGIEECISVLE